jgi:tetratricopeptide (TPR) repeat protein
LVDKSEADCPAPEDDPSVASADRKTSLDLTDRPEESDTQIDDRIDCESRIERQSAVITQPTDDHRPGGAQSEATTKPRRRVRVRIRQKVERGSGARSGRASSRGRLSLFGKSFVFIAILSHWTTAFLLLALPAYLSWDYGGVLAWSRWVAASTALGAAVLAIPMLLNTTVFRIAVTKSARENQENRAAIDWRVLLVPLLCAIGWCIAWLQTVPLGKSVVSVASRGSASAYRDWIPPAIRQEVLAASATDLFLPRARSIADGWHPVSVCVELTRSAQAGPAIFALVCLLSAIVFRTRRTLIVMLTVIAISGAMMAFFGISDQIRAPSPSANQSILNPQARLGIPFGSFVCRNNAAGYLNLTLAAAVGLLVYSFLKAKERSEGDEKYQIQPENWWDRPLFFLQNALLQIDAATVFALVLVIMNTSGVLASQSRGGALGLVAGGLITCLLTRTRTSKWWQPIAILVSVGGVAILLGSIGLIEPIRVRLETLWASDTPQDGRLGHWADALTAAWYHFPAGAGLGTHRYAYLPYQQHSAGAWFINADNTSVEWLVEGGAWLLPLVVAGVAIVAMSLLRIAGIRKAPHLTALIAAGWFMIGSQLVCQFFDFGILLPANYVTAAILVGAILGASGRRYRPDRPDLAPVDLSTETHHRLAIWATVVLACLLVWDAKVVARQNAITESLRNEVIRADGILGPLTLELVNRYADSPDPALQLAFASKGLAEQAAAGRKALSGPDLPKGVDASRDSTVEARRTIYYVGLHPQGAPPQDALLQGQSIESILAVRRHAINALMMCPLSDLARYHLVQTGFAAGDTEQTVIELLEGWVRLRTNFAPAIELASRLAAVYPSGDTAATIIRRLLVVDPGRLNAVWPIFPLVIGDREEIAISELLPDNVEMLVSALERRSGGGMMTGALRDNLIERADVLIQNDLSGASKLGKGADIAFLAGRLLWIRADVEGAETWFKQAVELNPSQTEYRYHWVESLEKLGRKSQAREQIAICLLQDPKNGKYRSKMRQLEGRPASSSR